MSPLLVQQKVSGGQQEEGHGVVHHVKGEHHQSSLLDHYKNANLKGVLKPYFRLDLIDPLSSSNVNFDLY